MDKKNKMLLLLLKIQTEVNLLKNIFFIIFLLIKFLHKDRKNLLKHFYLDLKVIKKVYRIKYIEKI